MVEPHRVVGIAQDVADAEKEVIHLSITVADRQRPALVPMMKRLFRSRTLSGASFWNPVAEKYFLAMPTSLCFL